MNSVRHDFASALNAALSRSSVGPVELANAVGVTRQTVHAWRNGESIPRTDTAYKVAEALDSSRLFGIVSRHRTTQCKGCGKFLVANGRQLRVFCNYTCRDRLRYGRTPRISAEAAAIARMCAQCEPEGACFAAECPLREWSPLPLVADVVVRSARPNTARRRAA